MTNQEINRLTFTESPEVKLLGNTFVQVPVILQYDDTPLIEVISGQKAGFTTRFSIYNTDGMDMAKVVGSQIYPTTEGKKAGVTLEYPDKMTVCKLNGRVVFEIRREEENSEKIWPEIQDHLNYLNEVYNLCFAVQFAMNGKNVSEFSKVYYAQMIILIRITDFIRCIQLLTIKGYPEQAGTLAASIFELAHTAVHFSYNQNATEKWLSANSISEQIRNIIGLNWEQLVKANVEHFGGGDHKNEYRVYKQLCWLKHSLPKMQVMIREDDGVRFNFGPYSDERSISHSWFSMEHAGRLTEFLLSLLDSPSEISSLIKGHLDKVTQMRNVLHERAKERFGTDNPFEPDVREDD